MEHPASLIGDYAPPAGSYDEILAGPGKVRPAWSGVARVLDELGADGRRARLSYADSRKTRWTILHGAVADTY